MSKNKSSPFFHIVTHNELIQKGYRNRYRSEGLRLHKMCSGTELSIYHIVLAAPTAQFTMTVFTCVKWKRKYLKCILMCLRSQLHDGCPLNFTTINNTHMVSIESPPDHQWQIRYLITPELQLLDNKEINV